jgi:nitrite reductase/ring-hydroxylating ferredoxin subunit
MPDFVSVAALDQLPSGTGTTVTVGDTSVALFNVDGTVYALNDSCKHAGSSLGSGELAGKTVRCRAHGWKYDVTTGFVNGIDGFGVATYAVKVVDGYVMVAVD